MQNSERKPNAALLEAKRKAKLRMNQKNPDPVVVKDIYSTVSCKSFKRKKNKKLNPKIKFRQ